MSKLRNLLGQKFGKLTVIARAENTKGNKTAWDCLCDCGNKTVVQAGNLTSGHTTTCGHCADIHVGDHFGYLRVISFHHSGKYGAYWLCECLLCSMHCVVRGGDLRNGHTRSCGCLYEYHGMSETWIYKEWCRIKRRCNDKNNPHYGGRDIKICDEWRDSFTAFYEYVSELEHFGEEGYSLDRIDNNKGYEPGNVRWATHKEQCRNKRSNVIVEYNGVEMVLKDAAELSGINFGALHRRYQVGDRGERLFRPVKR